MSLVGRYTTPTHIFTVPFDTGTISMMAVIYKQGGNVVLVKDLEDCTLGDKTVSCTLTEEETSLFKPNPQVQIQLRVGIGNARLLPESSFTRQTAQGRQEPPTTSRKSPRKPFL